MRLWRRNLCQLQLTRDKLTQTIYCTYWENKSNKFPQHCTEFITRHTHVINTWCDATHTCRQRSSCRWDSRRFMVGEGYEVGTHRVMWSVPLRDWLVLEAAGSSLGWAEPMALQGGVLGLPGQQVKQSGESKALHTHTSTWKHTHTHLRHEHMTYKQVTNSTHTHIHWHDQ